MKTCRTRGSRQLNVELQAEVDAAERGRDHPELDERRDEHRDRVRVQRFAVFGTSVEVRVQDDEPDDDHEIPDRGRDRGDREMFVGLQDPDKHPHQAEQQDDSEQHL